ncbi:MAG: hypothetical protein BWY59_00099 [Verrucomicrobia bacterium ADurb.Bin345]|nr:MAG: hypothetical protein BWY59_00099 [Verrucomicrobia bacterium ADurb.Bin345]
MRKAVNYSIVLAFIANVCVTGIALELKVVEPRGTGDGFEFSYASDTGMYYQVWSRGGLTTGSWSLAGMLLGSSGTQWWAAARSVSVFNEHYYRLRQIPRTQPYDEDNDGLDDVAELELGTEPLIRDTDGDGLNDGPEVCMGLDPLRSNEAVRIVIHSPKNGGKLP